MLTSYQAVESMRNGMDPESAARDAIQRIIKKNPEFSGAVIAANKAGDFGMRHSNINQKSDTKSN